MTKHEAADRIIAGIGRYGVVYEPNGSYTVVAQHGEGERYPLIGVTHKQAWDYAVKRERAEA